MPIKDTELREFKQPAKVNRRQGAEAGFEQRSF